MSRTSEQQLEARVSDLESAMKIIGELLSDEAKPVKRRIDMALGILWRYDCAPKDTKAPTG